MFHPITRIIQSLYYALPHPAIVPIEGAVLFELPITKTDHNQNGPLPKRTIIKMTIEIKNVNFLNKFDIL